MPTKGDRPVVADWSNDEKTAGSISALTQKNVQAIAELEQVANLRRSRADRMADTISRFVGSMAFVYLHVIWFGIWIAWCTLPFVPNAWNFDPYPFTFLTFLVSLEAIFLSTFILISQNHEERLARRRNHLDLQINLLSEQENSQMLKMLDRIERQLQIRGDLASEVLTQEANPGEMIAQIESEIEDRKSSSESGPR